MIPFTRGYIAGLRGASLWLCPYWIDIDEDRTTDPRAIKWTAGWSRGRRLFRKPPPIEAFDWDEEEPF